MVLSLVAFDVMLYAILVADWVARWRLRDDELKGRLDELVEAATTQRTLVRTELRRQGPGRRRRRVAGSRRVRGRASL